jgi:multicomponent Na+:H+ antiporter subunit A
MDRLYEAGLTGLENGSRALTASYMSGFLWRYLIVILSVAAVSVLAGMALAPVATTVGSWSARPAQAFELVVIASALGAGIATVRARTRLAAILALGANGYCIALLFSLLRAPDLALTQVMVETISVALFLTVFVFLPPYRPADSRGRLRLGHLALSATFGFGVAGLVHLARAARVEPSIAGYYIENSVAKAGGHNIVNVILVDFRGLDTLGEITVLGVAALAAYAIVKGLRARQAA